MSRDRYMVQELGRGKWRAFDLVHGKGVSAPGTLEEVERAAEDLNAQEESGQGGFA